MKRLLFTGAGGFIGRNAIPHLIDRGYEVHAVDVRPLDLDGCHVHTADLLDTTETRRVVEAIRPTHLLHMAWYVEHGKFWTSVENTRWVGASLALLDAFIANGGKRVVTTGTCAEYETGHALCVEEETPCRPETLYGACKYALSVMQSALCRQSGVSQAWPRIFFLYGPDEPARKLVPAVITSLLNGEPALTSHGEQLRDFLHVEDVARAIVHVLDSDLEGPVNIASGEPVSLRSVIETIARLIGRPDLLRIGAIPAAMNEPERLVGSVARLQSIGFTPKHTLEEGLRLTIELRQKVTG